VSGDLNALIGHIGEIKLYVAEENKVVYFFSKSLEIDIVGYKFCMGRHLVLKGSVYDRDKKFASRNTGNFIECGCGREG
jgi:hypothetical protein